MSADLNGEKISEAYNAVRDDNNEAVEWAVLKYEENTIDVCSTGSDYEKFLTEFSDDERVFGFVRVTVGDEMSKRDKFVLVSWTGVNISALKRGRMNGDKPSVKRFFQSFALEIQTDTFDELSLEYVKEELKKVGGANYGTGQRD